MHAYSFGRQSRERRIFGPGGKEGSSNRVVVVVVSACVREEEGRGRGRGRQGYHVVK